MSVEYNVHRRVQAYKDEHGLTNTAMAELLGVSRQAFHWFMYKGNTNVGLAVSDGMDLLEQGEEVWS